MTNAEQPVAETASQPTQPQAPDLTAIKAEYESQLNALKKQVAEEQEKFKGAKINLMKFIRKRRTKKTRIRRSRSMENSLGRG